MFFSNAITFFVIIAAAATLHAQGHTDVQTAVQAAQVLKPLAGDFTFAACLPSASSARACSRFP